MKKLTLCAAILAAISSSIANADTIVQNWNILPQTSVGSGTTPAGFNETGDFQAFSFAGATLNSVELTIWLSGTAQMGVLNPIGAPLPLTPTITVRDYLSFQNAPLLNVDAAAAFSGTPTVIPPFGTYQFSSDILLSQTWTFIDPDQLAVFLSDPVQLRSLCFIKGNDDFGGISATAGETLTLTYNYSVPDISSTLLLLGSALGLVGLARRRLI